ncbi:MAG: RagB/SusD family nutrient uptake outer membrane protein, partial [Paludibacteraceae bacterium]|nr:RagB/SusD family nutrient uptake outer membrane protein [Paludibacteraceae bacterium]
MKYTKIFFAALLGLGMTACSLDREPLDPNTDTHFNKDAVLAKCYATFGTTGQKGPDGSGDVDGIDEGTSSFYRMFWELNEFCTDEGWWIWNDVGLADIRTQTWSASNDLVYGLYSRLNFDITLCNSFLDNTSEYTDAETLAQRAEVRMLRAINFYYLLDMFY